MIYHSWARVSPPTTSGEVSRLLWTKPDVLTLLEDFSTRNHHFEPVSDPRQKVYVFVYLNVEHVAVMMSTRNFHTSEIVPLYTF